MSRIKNEDIINMPHHRSSSHRPMDISARAAQFSPFVALTGHGDAIREAGRITQRRIEYDEDMLSDLEGKLSLIRMSADEHPEVEIVHFISDEKKEGGEYIVSRGRVKEVDEYDRAIVMEDGVKIKAEDIRTIEGRIFDRLT